MSRKKRNSSVGFSFFPFLDILFSTMGILVLVSSVNFLLVQFEINSPSRPIYTKEEIHDIINNQDLLGSFYWLEPVYLTITDKAYTIYQNGKKEIITDQDKMENRLLEIAEKNCLNKEENKAGRSVIVFGIYQSGYLFYNSLSLAIEEINRELKLKYGRNFFPLQEGKELLSAKELPPNWQKIVNVKNNLSRQP